MEQTNTRIDVTSNEYEDVDALAARLRETGFDVDHFHAVEVDEEIGEVVTHFNSDESGVHFEPDCAGVSRDPRGWHRLVADVWHE